MQLSRKILAQINDQQVAVPADHLFSLPEKVLQFGTGVLLRGLPDYFIDRANKTGVFNGRIVVIKSTANGGTDAFAKQNGLYTLLERGVDNGERSERTVINASISRVLSAATEWGTILQCAVDPSIQVIISNTTEVGITLLESDATTERPVSFPGRLLDILLARYKAFNGSNESGMVIIPTELVPDNGTKLKNIVLTLASLKGLSSETVDWLANANDFCNSLVDCIVPGKLSAGENKAAEKELGYEDQLMIMSEPYRLWAIETKRERTKEILSFSQTDEGVIISPDINKFRELKLRLLNGTHTFSCALAHLAGFTTVKEAMQHADFAAFISGLMTEEIAPLVVSEEISSEEAMVFAAQVADRFKNPFIEHLWLSISMQYTSKMAMRTVPLLEKYYELYGHVPELMTAGFAAFIIFMHTEKNEAGEFYGQWNGKKYQVQDDKAALLQKKWEQGDTENVIDSILKDPAVFGRDLSIYPGFAATVNRYVSLLTEKGATDVLHSLANKKTLA